MRTLKILVAVMGVLIIGGTVTLGVMLVQRMNSISGGTGATAWVIDGQPSGSRIIGVATAEAGLALLVQHPNGERVLLVDPKRRQVIGEIRMAP